jgi:hypothetical protein
VGTKAAGTEKSGAEAVATDAGAAAGDTPPGEES